MLDEGKEDALRAQVLAALKKKQDFHTHLLVYILVNGMVIAIWALTGSGFFWPLFPLLGWGVGVLLNAWDVYFTHAPKEEQIRREMDRLR
jgi:hypothetical protein